MFKNALVYTNLFEFNCETKKLFVYARIRSWNHPVLSNWSKVSCSMKERGLELTTDRYPSITSHTRFPLRQAASKVLYKCISSISVYVHIQRLSIYVMFKQYKNTPITDKSYKC